MEEIESYVIKYRLDTNEKDKALFFSCEMNSNDYFRVCISSISLL
jgi:hypothetical protein